ncbi:MAG: ester cyclase [Chloroflexi bacterium]|nr:ester cyclase [Chloroflexota bacterium]
MATRASSAWPTASIPPYPGPLGTHLGEGLFGHPSGKRVEVMGITHARLEHGLVQEEWTVFDELAVLKQTCVPD